MSYKRKTTSNDSFTKPTARKPAVHPYQRFHEELATVVPVDAHLPYRQRFPKFGTPYSGFRSPLQSPYAKKSVTPESDYIPKKSQAAVKRLLAGVTKTAFTQTTANLNSAFGNVYPAAPGILQLLSPGTTNKIDSTKDSVFIKSIQLRGVVQDYDTSVQAYDGLWARIILVWVTSPNGNAASGGTSAAVADFLVDPTSIYSHIIPETQRQQKFEVLSDQMIDIGGNYYSNNTRKFQNFNFEINKTTTTAVPGTFTYQTVTNGVPYLILLGNGDTNVSQHVIRSFWGDALTTYES